MPAAAAAAAAAVKNPPAAATGAAGRLPQLQTKIIAIFKSEKVGHCLHANSVAQLQQALAGVHVINHGMLGSAIEDVHALHATETLQQLLSDLALSSSALEHPT
jgi:hypothetical protein